MAIKCSQRKNGTLRCSAGLEWHGYHGISDTEASASAPAVGRPSKSAGCLAAHKRKKKQPSLASTYVTPRSLLSSSTIVRRGVIQVRSQKNGMAFQAFPVHQLSPYVNPLDIVMETQQCRLRRDWMCTRPFGPHNHMQSTVDVDSDTREKNDIRTPRVRSAASPHSKKTHWKTSSSSPKPHMAIDSARSVS